MKPFHVEQALMAARRDAVRQLDSARTRAHRFAVSDGIPVERAVRRADEAWRDANPGLNALINMSPADAAARRFPLQVLIATQGPPVIVPGPHLWHPRTRRMGES